MIWRTLRVRTTALVVSDLAFISEDCNYFCALMTLLMLFHLSGMTCLLHPPSPTSHTPWFSPLPNSCSSFQVLPKPYFSMKYSLILPIRMKHSHLWIFTGVAPWLLRCVWFCLINFLPLLTMSSLMTVSEMFFIPVSTASHIISVFWIDLDRWTISYTLAEKGEVCLV